MSKDEIIMTAETPAKNLPLLIKVWTNHILPHLPLGTILNVTTLMNKETSSAFRAYEEDVWFNYIKKQHMYLLGIRTACEYYYENVKAMSWTTYARGCFSGDYSKENYAIMLGNCHATLFGSRYDHISQALVILGELKEEIGVKNYQKFFNSKTGLLKTDDVFNAFGVFLDMFDPAFSKLYTNTIAILEKITRDLKIKVEKHSISNMSHSSKCVDEVVRFLRKIMRKSNKAAGDSQFPANDLVGILRFICCPKFHKNNLSVLLVIFIELMRRLGYTVDLNKLCCLPTSYPDRYMFTFKKTANSFYGLMLHKETGLQWVLNECDQHWTFDRMIEKIEHIQNSSDCAIPNVKVPILLDLYFQNSVFMDFVLPTYHFEHVIRNNRDFIFSVKYPYGIDVVPKSIDYKIPLDLVNFNADVCPAHGCFAWSSQNMAVIVGFDTGKQKYYCLNMMNTLFLENPINLVILDNLCYPSGTLSEHRAEPKEVLHAIFKYNTQIGMFFKRYADNRFAGFLL